MRRFLKISLAYLLLLFAIGDLFASQNLLLGSRRRDELPVGIIVLFDDTSVPTGWERFTSADSKHIVGAGSTYAAGATGGAAASVSQATSEAGTHTGDSVPISFIRNTGASEVPGYPSYRSIESGGSVTDGEHTHTLTTTYNMGYQQILLIRSTAAHTEFPANAVIFGDGGTTPIVGLSIVYDDNVSIRSGASITSASGAYFSSACTDQPETHAHETLGQYYDPDGATTAYGYSTSGSALSDHTFTPSLSDQDLKRTYLSAWKGSGAFKNATGVIGMWESAVPPPGWKLCDGTNGTLDLRDYFIFFGDTGTAGDQYAETNQIVTALSIDNDTWAHNHFAGTYNNIDAGSVVSGWHGNFNATHGHTAADDTQAYVPPYYALTFIQRN